MAKYIPLQFRLLSAAAMSGGKWGPLTDDDAAQGMAPKAETENTGSVHDGPVGSADAPEHVPANSQGDPTLVTLPPTAVRIEYDDTIRAITLCRPYGPSLLRVLVLPHDCCYRKGRSLMKALPFIIALLALSSMSCALSVWLGSAAWAWFIGWATAIAIGAADRALTKGMRK